MSTLPSASHLLNELASNGDYSGLQLLCASSKFTQEEVDTAFRKCIKAYKDRDTPFMRCTSLFIQMTMDINYRNPNYNNTTILMYAIEENKEGPCDLIMSCVSSEIDSNICDNNNETCLFKLVKNKTFQADPSYKLNHQYLNNLLYKFVRYVL